MPSCSTAHVLAPEPSCETGGPSNATTSASCIPSCIFAKSSAVGLLALVQTTMPTANTKSAAKLSIRSIFRFVTAGSTCSALELSLFGVLLSRPRQLDKQDKHHRSSGEASEA